MAAAKKIAKKHPAKKDDHELPWWAKAGIALIILGAVGSILEFFVADWLFKSKMLTWRVERTIWATQPVPYDSLKAHEAKLLDGSGVKLLLVRQSGRSLDSVEVRLDSLASRPAKQPRLNQIAAFRKRLQKAEAEFYAGTQFHLPLTVFTDVTEGGDTAVLRRIQTVSAEFNLKGLLGKGHGLEVSLRRLTEGEFADGWDFELAPGTGAQGLQMLRDSIQQLIAGQLVRSESCIFYGLWEALGKLPERQTRVVVIHSDGAENCPRTFSLYNGWNQILAKRNWLQLDRQLKDGYPGMPDLSQMRIYWIIPRATGAAGSRVRMIEKYLEHLLEEKGKAKLKILFMA